MTIMRNRREPYIEKWRRVVCRDGLRCQYCGFDGTKSPGWLFLTVDHIIPKRYALRVQQFGLQDIDDDENLITACRFCNTVENRWEVPADISTPTEAREAKMKAIKKKREEHDRWWDELSQKASQELRRP